MTINQVKNMNTTALVKRGAGIFSGIFNNSGTESVTVFDGTELAVAGVGTLTSSGAMAPADYARNTLTSSGAMVPATHATSVLTSDATQPSAAETVTIGATVYTFRADPTAAYDVRIGATVTQTLQNLRKAINATGAAGYDYGIGTLVHPDVVSSASDATTVTVWGRVAGTSLNTKATTETSAHLSWPDTTLGGGTGASDPGVATTAATVTIGTTVYTVVVELSESLGAVAVPYEVLYGGTEALMLANLKKAINATGTAGTNYGTGTAVHPDVFAGTLAATTLQVAAKVIGTAANTIATTETMANTAWADTTLGGGTGVSKAGVTAAAATLTIGTTTYTFVLNLAETFGLPAVPYQILWVTDEATAIINLKKAINGSGTMGTTYGTGTVPHPLVIATTISTTTLVVQAKVWGVSGNSIATTETLANYAFGAATLASGAGADATIILNAFVTVAATRYPVPPTAFTRGLYVVLSTTGDVSVFFD